MIELSNPEVSGLGTIPEAHGLKATIGGAGLVTPYSETKCTGICKSNYQILILVNTSSVIEKIGLP
jgi:hypothetical protein